MTTREDLLPIYEACKADFKRKHGVASPSGYVEVPKGWDTEYTRQLARDGLIKIVATRHYADRKAGKFGGWRLV